MGLCLHPLVSVPDAVGRGTTVAPLASRRCSITMMLEGCLILQSDDDISYLPPKSCFHLLLGGSTSRLGEGLGVIGICSGLIFGIGTSSIARPPLPACSPFFYTFQRV